MVRFLLHLCCLVPLVLPAQGLPPVLATQLRTLAADAQLSPTEVADYRITHQHTNAVTGITHFYLQQVHNGLPVHGATAGLHLSAQGQPVAGDVQFRSNLSELIQPGVVALTAADALRAAFVPLGIAVAGEVSEASRAGYRWLMHPVLHQPARAQLLYFPVGKTYVPTYELLLDPRAQPELMAVYVDARSGEVVHRQSLKLSCDHASPRPLVSENHEKAAVPAAAPFLVPQYRVYEFPVESPTWGNRSMVANPATLNPTASPNGWHQINGTDYTDTRGNNVDAYLDTDSTNTVSSPADRADGGAALLFDFAHNPGTDPTLYQDAAVTNVFYVSNVVHDVLYNYGFTPAAGNFEAADTDDVRAEVQDASGRCNANFATPPDGMRPRMQMYTCNSNDGAFDNGVILHEYGHGVSNRLTGGPANASCLFNAEQMGEGWSDYLAIIHTMLPTHTAATPRPIGNWLFNRPASHKGIRPTAYSRDMGINGTTYADIANLSRPHGVGYAWCTMLWDLTWDLIDLYGFDPDTYNGTGGNNKALRLVMAGMQLQPCSPGFVDGRDAILAADAALFGGIHQQLIWSAFARRGLGYSAAQGSSQSKSDQLEAYDLPPAFGLSATITTDKTVLAPGEDLTVTVTLQNNGAAVGGLRVALPLPPATTLLPGSGATVANGEVRFDNVAVGGGGNLTLSYALRLDANAVANPPDFFEGFEAGSGDWVAATTGAPGWTITNGAGVGGSNAMVGPTQDYSALLTLTNALPFGLTATSRLRFRTNLASELHWDGGTVELSTDNGRTWSSLASHFTSGGYNDYINNNPQTPAFSGNVSGFLQSEIDLGNWADEAVLVRFNVHSDPAVNVPNGGWTLDNVELTDRQLLLPLSAVLTDGAQRVVGTGRLPQAVRVGSALPVRYTAFTAEHATGERTNVLRWRTATETNSSHFVVEHRTDTGVFADIDEQRAAGTSTTARDYRFRHRGVAPGVHYYRLRQIDLDGSAHYSRVVTVTAGTRAGITLFPNPARHRVQLRLSGEAGPETVVLYDLHGREVYRTTVGGNALSTLDLRHLPAGLYTLRVPGWRHVERLLLTE